MNRIINHYTIVSVQTLKNLRNRCYASSSKSIVTELEVEETPAYDVEPKYTQEEVEQMTNKSRLYPQHRRMLNDEKPYDQSYGPFHDAKWYRKKMLGKYGMEAAGVPAGICWPTKEDIEETKEYEHLAYPMTIQEVKRQIEQKKIEEELTIRKREEEIDKVVANFDKWREALQAKVEKKEAELTAAKEKKERMMQEIREEFGFNIDPRDERFKQMMEKKEKEDKKRKKEEKKKKKDEKMLAFLAQAEKDAQAKRAAEKADSAGTEGKNAEEQPENKIVDKDKSKKTEL